MLACCDALEHACCVDSVLCSVTIRRTNLLRHYACMLQVKWDKTEEKPAVIAITSAAFVGVWALSGLVDRIDKLPIIGGLLELVGLVVTSWFVYRYLVFGPDR